MILRNNRPGAWRIAQPKTQQVPLTKEIVEDWIRNIIEKENRDLQTPDPEADFNPWDRFEEPEEDNEVEEEQDDDHRLAEMLGVCSCIRQMDDIKQALAEIRRKIRGPISPSAFSPAEYLAVALLDQYTDVITHGTNIEYPILMKEEELWDNIYMEGSRH